MKPSPSFLHSPLSSIILYVICIIFGNLKGPMSTGYVVDNILTMNEESQLHSSSRCMSNVCIRSNMRPSTMVQQRKSLFTCMKSSMDKNVKKLWFSNCQTPFDSQKLSRCLTYLFRVLYVASLSLRSIVWHPHQSMLVMIGQLASLSYNLSHHSKHSLFQWWSSWDVHLLSQQWINSTLIIIFWTMLLISTCFSVYRT